MIRPYRILRLLASRTAFSSATDNYQNQATSRLLLEQTNFRWRLPGARLATSPAAATSPKAAGASDVKVTFLKEGKSYEAYGKDGDTLLDLIINNELDFDGFGACEGTLACSTCHVILDKKDYDIVPNKPCDEELDMLDLAYDLTDTFRLRNPWTEYKFRYPPRVMTLDRNSDLVTSVRNISKPVKNESVF